MFCCSLGVEAAALWCGSSVSSACDGPIMSRCRVGKGSEHKSRGSSVCVRARYRGLFTLLYSLVGGLARPKAKVRLRPTFSTWIQLWCGSAAGRQFHLAYSVTVHVCTPCGGNPCAYFNCLVGPWRPLLYTLKYMYGVRYSGTRNRDSPCDEEVSRLDTDLSGDRRTGTARSPAH